MLSPFLLSVLPLLYPSPASCTETQVLAIEHASVLPMRSRDAKPILEDHTVIVRDGKIAELGPSASVRVPDGAVRVDGRGKFLMPGMVDMHVHVMDQAELELYLANGVTTVRNLMGFPSHLEMRDAITAGELLGPTIYTSGPFTNEPDVGTPEEAERAAEDQKRAGYDCVKIHGSLPLETFERLVTATRRVGLPLIGHVPRNLDLEVVLKNGGLSEISHAEEYIYTWFERQGEGTPDERMARIVARSREAGVTVTPTLVAYAGIIRQVRDLNAELARHEMAYLSPFTHLVWGPALNKYRKFGAEELPNLATAFDLQKKLVLALHQAGVRILVGTDAMNPATIPGFSIHEELALLRECGLEPRAILEAATVQAAEFLGAAAQFGSVQPGLRADLVLVDGNPLEDLAHLQFPAGIVVRGRWLSRAELGRRLESLARELPAEQELASRLRPSGPREAIDWWRSTHGPKHDARAPRADFCAYVGQAYLGLKNAAAAREVLEFGVELHPKSFALRNRLAEACARGGDKATAVQCYRRSLELAPDNTQAVKGLAKLDAQNP